MPLRDRNRIGVCGDLVPDIAHQLDLLLDREASNLGDQSFFSHVSKVAVGAAMDRFFTWTTFFFPVLFAIRSPHVVRQSSIPKYAR